jgi:hypothetical protein
MTFRRYFRKITRHHDIDKDWLLGAPFFWKNPNDTETGHFVETD